MRILITGPDGQIGWEMARALMPYGELLAVGSAEMDLADPSAIRRTVRDLQPDLIVNAAGYTAVDRAEVEPELAAAVNAIAVGILGEEARRLGAAVVHFSTDYVFDGRKRSPYTPADLPNPLSVYAQTKLDGENALINSGASYLIIRTSWVYGSRGRNFLRAILQQAAIKPKLRIVNDQTGSPTWCRPLAQATVNIIQQALTGKAGHRSFGGREGLYHLCGGGETTWFDFAQRILNLADFQPKPALVPISTEEYGAPTRRPAYSVLDCSKTADVFNVGLEDWDVALEDFFRTQPVAAAPPVTAAESGGHG